MNYVLESFLSFFFIPFWEGSLKNSQPDTEMMKDYVKSGEMVLYGTNLRNLVNCN